MRQSMGPLYAGVFLISLAGLALEVILSRMFALTFWYHFAFIILSVALFGIGLGGLLVYFTDRFVKKRLELTLGFASLAFAFSIPAVFLAVNGMQVEMGQVAVSADQQFRFGQMFLALIVPFMFAGYIFSLVFSHFSRAINRVYFFDLLGGGIGCFFALLAFPHLGPLGTSLLISSLAVIAAFFFLWPKYGLKALPVLILLFVNQIALKPAMLKTEVRISQEKRNMEILGKRIASDWDNFGFVAVHDRTNGSRVMTADYSCFTYLYPVRADSRPEDFAPFKIILRSHYYPYAVVPRPGTVGIVGVGGGKDVQLALGVGAREIYGAEFNRTILRMFSRDYSGYIGNIAQYSNVHIVFEEGRYFIQSSPRRYDVLVFDNSIAQTAVSSGSFTLAESYLYTVEALEEYLRHLNPGGVLYLSNPFVQSQRFLSLIREAFRKMGREKEAARSVIVVEEPANYRKVKILVKSGSFTPAETVAVRNLAASQRHNILYDPYSARRTPEEEILRSSDVRKVYAVSDQDLRPSTDDWPFFSQHIRPDADADDLGRDIAHARQFYPQPFLLLRQITGQVALYSVLFLLVPLFFLNIGGLRRLPNKLQSLVYFASIGLGFMLLEVAMMQKYTLLLGHPVYSFSVVLATLLMSSGLGSLVSYRVKNPFRLILVSLLGIAGSTALSFAAVHFLQDGIIGMPFAVRVGFVVLLTGLSGFFMGAMMPSGIRALSRHTRAIPWMWSVNGVFSVVASFIAVYLSIRLGYTAVFLSGLGVYALGTAAFAIRYSVRG